MDFEETMRGRNETLDVYPNRPALVVIEQDGQRIVRQDMLWGFSSQALATAPTSGA
jgi:hypothetical protein